jgi:lysine 2,3-aminomutase
MPKLVVTSFVTLDGIMQAPGGPREDRSGAFLHGGWVMPFADEGFGKAVLEVVGRLGALLLGRGTYEIFANHWPKITDPADPIAAQFVPDPAELDMRDEENGDPIGDAPMSPVPGLVHRYPDRVLLMPTHVCASYCRFCFRREMIGPGKENALSPADFDRAIAYVASHPQIWEVILTGGDPLMLTPERVARLTQGLAAIAHIDVIRWHSRVPVVAPERITDAMVQALSACDRAVWVSVHANHPDELTAASAAAIRRLAKAGIALVSQTVLLRGVNDAPAVLDALFRRLIRLGVKPYYLHHPDLAPGTGHFRLSIADGQKIVAELRGRLSGLAQPTYVLDIPGGAGKSPLTPAYWDAETGRIRDWRGQGHDYPA